MGRFTRGRWHQAILICIPIPVEFCYNKVFDVEKVKALIRDLDGCWEGGRGDEVMQAFLRVESYSFSDKFNKGLLDNWNKRQDALVAMSKALGIPLPGKE